MRRRRITIEEAEARQPDLVKGQEWSGTTATYLYECLKHGAYEQRYFVHARSQGCEKCSVEKRIAEGRYFTNHNDSPELFRSK